MDLQKVQSKLEFAIKFSLWLWFAPLVHLSRRGVVEKLIQGRLGCQLLRAIRTRHPRANANQQVIIVSHIAFQLPISALLVGGIHLVLALRLVEGYPLRDEYPVGALVRDVAEVELRHPHRQPRLQQPRGVDFSTLAIRLREQRRQHAIGPRLVLVGPGNLREELRVQALRRLGILDIEDHLCRGATADILLDILDLAHRVSLRERARCVERLRAPRGTHSLQGLGGPRELQAEQHAFRDLLVLLELLGAQWRPRHGRLLQLPLATSLDGFVGPADQQGLPCDLEADPTRLRPCAAEPAVLQPVALQLELLDEGA
mmetsp:Transcript_144349/g.462431  ORF Transcript_144349/g.462431 Transcript_144349/m.462431 type:complete len:315 (+) Transcript_144349:751-1695(+)